MGKRSSSEYVRWFFGNISHREPLLPPINGLQYLQMYSPRLFQLLHNVCYKDWRNSKEVLCRDFLDRVLGSSTDLFPTQHIACLLPHIDCVAIDAKDHLFTVTFLHTDISTPNLWGILESWCEKLLELMEKYEISSKRPLYLYDSLCDFNAVVTHQENARVFLNYLLTLPHFKRYIEDNAKGQRRTLRAEGKKWKGSHNFSNHELIYYYAKCLEDLFEVTRPYLISKTWDASIRAQLQLLREFKEKHKLSSFLFMHNLIRILSTLYLSDHLKPKQDSLSEDDPFFMAGAEAEAEAGAGAGTEAEAEAGAGAVFNNYPMRRRQLRQLRRLLSLLVGRWIKKPQRESVNGEFADRSPVWSLFHRVVRTMNCFKDLVIFQNSTWNSGTDVFSYAIHRAHKEKKTLLCVTPLASRVLLAYSKVYSNVEIEERCPLFLHNDAYLLYFYNLRRTAGKATGVKKYQEMLQYYLRPIVGRGLFGKLFAPVVKSTTTMGARDKEVEVRCDEIKKLTSPDAYQGDRLKYHFLANLFVEYNQPAALSKVYLRTHHKNRQLSLFACLRLCAVERSALPDYEAAVEHFQSTQAWKTENSLQAHVENLASLQCMYERYRKKDPKNLELLYGLLLLEQVGMIYLQDVTCGFAT